MKALTSISCAALVSIFVAAGSVTADNRSNDHYQGRSEVFYVEGRVVNATPIYESYWYYRSRGDNQQDRYNQTCRVREVEVYRESSRSSAPAGTIIGGAIGAHVGNNAGRSVESTIVGAIAGGVIGSVIGGEIDRGRDDTTVHYRVERDCDTRYREEHRELIGYDVRYRYNGREFSIQTEQHPGRYVQLRVELQPSVR